MIETTTYNSDLNSMDWEYLRSRLLSTFPIQQGPTTIPPQIFIPDEERIDCDCCSLDKTFIYPAVADINDSSPNKNDFCPVLFQTELAADEAEHILQKYNGTAFIDIVTLGPSYGTPFNPGIFTDYPEFCGFKLEWRQVLINHGTGIYRIKSTIISLGVTQVFYNDPYCLKEYSIYAADKTVKFEWYGNGIVSYADDGFVELNYGNINWHQMIRLKGSFGYQTEEQEVVEASYFFGTSLRTDRIHDTINYKYKFKSGPYPHQVHSLLKNLAFKSNNLTVTTYGLIEKRPYVTKEILKDSNGYSPDYGNVYNKWYKVEVDFRDKYEDLGARKHCKPSGENCEPVTIKDSDGNIIGTVQSGGTYIESTGGGGGCSSITVKDTEDFSQSITCAQSPYTIPDRTIEVFLDGVSQGTVTVPALSNNTINLVWD